MSKPCGIRWCEGTGIGHWKPEALPYKSRRKGICWYGILNFRISQIIRFRYLFHGTSSLYKRGLLPCNGVLHLTTHPFVALLEAWRTVSGERGFPGAHKPGVGGWPVVVKIERSAVMRLRSDPEWYDKGQAIGRRLVQVRGEFSTDITCSSLDLI